MSFYEKVLRQLPPGLIQRFVYLSESSPEPSEKEFEQWRRRLLGTARRTLMREQIHRIKHLPHLPGPGRRHVETEYREIRQLFHELKDSGRTATEAVRIVAERHHYTERNVWKILKHSG